MVGIMEDRRKALVLKLHEISVFKFGEFTLKSGLVTPVYFDLRVVVSYPDVMDELTDLMKAFIEERGIQCDQLCGVPYAALPLATLLSIKMKQPMLIRRKEVKGYGTNKLIEGRYQTDENCVIVEDVVVSGLSIYETAVDLRRENLKVTDTVVVVDRDQGGVKNMAENGIRLHPLFTLAYLMKTLKEAGKIDEKMVVKVSEFIEKSQCDLDLPILKPPRLTMTFAERSKHAKSEIARALLKIMDLKKSNLCLAVDLTKSDEILNVVESVGPYICLLKTHVDIIEDFSENFVKSLQAAAEKHNFLIMEDRKFADIGNTVSLQYSKGVYKISHWADLVTVHSLPGSGVLKGLKSAVTDAPPRAAFLIAEMSCDGNLISGDYKQKTMKMARDHSDFVAGIVCQSAEFVQEPGIIQLTPGVQLEEGSDNLGQKYNTPELVIKEKGADIAVVGRGIIASKNPEEVAKTYRDRLWEAYTSRVKN